MPPPVLLLQSPGSSVTSLSGLTPPDVWCACWEMEAPEDGKELGAPWIS